MKTFSRKYRDNDIGDEEKVQVAFQVALWHG
jgi:hypothetical protein